VIDSGNWNFFHTIGYKMGTRLNVEKASIMANKSFDKFKSLKTITAEICIKIIQVAFVVYKLKTYIWFFKI